MDDKTTKYANYEYSEISNFIFQAFFTVYNELGFCFEKSVYEKSLVIELQNLGLNCRIQRKNPIIYKNKEVGTYLIDIIVENKIMLQILTNEEIRISDEQKMYQFLRACELEVGYILNFGQKPTYRRKNCANQYKRRLKKDLD